MTTDQATIIAGFGFDTEAAAPDLADLDEVLARIAASGASHAELSLCGYELIAGGRILAERRRKLEQICARHRLAYTVHGTLAVNFMDEAHLDLHKAVCRAMLELCDAVGASVMVQHPGKVPARPAPVLERLHAIERDALREMGDVAARYGVRIAVETLFVEEPQRYTADPVRLAAEIAAIDHPQVCGALDFSHAYIITTFRGMDYMAALRAFAPCTNHLHVHDSFGRPTTMGGFYSHPERIAFGMGDLHLPMGWGDIPWEEILPQLAFRPGTAMIVELPPRHMAELESCAATARRFMDIVNRAQCRAA
ncbi:MAG TPA: sugar phosphate isomerase/epimerase [Geminicoccaceae bacterium]|nr:sugar phosphate isomerase/epimerase [Geminicoccaceae bacterium]